MRPALMIGVASAAAVLSGCTTTTFMERVIDARAMFAGAKPFAPPCAQGRCSVKLVPATYNCDVVVVDPYVLDVRREGNAVRVEVELPAEFKFFDDRERPAIYIKSGYDAGLIVAGPKVEDVASKGDSRKATFVLRNPAGGLNVYGIRFGRSWRSSAHCEADPWIVD